MSDLEKLVNDIEYAFDNPRLPSYSMLSVNHLARRDILRRALEPLVTERDELKFHLKKTTIGSFDAIQAMAKDNASLRTALAACEEALNCWPGSEVVPIRENALTIARNALNTKP